MTEDRLPPLSALRAFEAAARLESVSRAAEALHVTHGAVSRQIRSLEQDLGVSLFTRQGRGLILTVAGMRLRDSCGQAFAQLQQTCTQLRQGQSQPALVVACPSSLLARWVIPRLARLEQELPNLKLHWSASERDPTRQLPGVDAALLAMDPPWPALQVHALATERIGPVLSPRHPQFERLRHSTPAQLMEELLLHTDSRPQAWPAWAIAHGLDATALRYGSGFEHLYFLLEAASAGLGVAIAPEPLVADDLSAGHLVAPWGFVDTNAQWVLCTPLRSSDARVPTLAAWLRQELRFPDESAHSAQGESHH